MDKRFFVFTVFLMLSVAAFALPVHNIDSGEDFSGIQDAVYDSDTFSGHTITVDAGTYNESVSVTKSLTIRSSGADPSLVVVAPESAGPGFRVTADYVSISGFTVSGSSSEGVYIYYASGSNISGNVFTGNDVGVGMYQGNDGFICDNGISENLQKGIYVYYSSGNLVSGNNVSGHTYHGIGLSNIGGNTFTRNRVSGNNVGLYVYSSSVGNVLYLNSFYENNVSSSDNAESSWNSSGVYYEYGGSVYEGQLGNYWDDYSGADSGGDGVGDVYYSAGPAGTDRYPLMESSEQYALTDTPPTTTTTTQAPGTTTSTTTSTTQAGECSLAGDSSPCGEISLTEVIEYITLWSVGEASLSDVINLISAWAGG